MPSTKEENVSAADTPASTTSYYLLKAEPDTRIVKGKDVKFSVDDFEEVKTSPWEGVRNFEARNIMKEMKVGDKALFYHSSCKNPGIAAFAEVSRQAYPDFTAWDASHPYYDVKTDKENPKWFMVDLTYVSRPAHFVPLTLLKYLASATAEALPSELAYVGQTGIDSIKGMDLVARGRLSVQRVRPEEWDLINKLAENGGWDELNLKKKPAAATTKRKQRDDEQPASVKKPAAKPRGKASKVKEQLEESDAESALTELEDEPDVGRKRTNTKKPPPREPVEGVRRSKRHKGDL